MIATLCFHMSAKFPCTGLTSPDKMTALALMNQIAAALQSRPNGAMLRRIRDLNDEINKLIREKGHWEVRILELGGPDYARAAPKVQDSQGFEIQGATGKGAGYRWFAPQVLCCKSALCAHFQLAALLPKS